MRTHGGMHLRTQYIRCTCHSTRLPPPTFYTSSNTKVSVKATGWVIGFACLYVCVHDACMFRWCAVPFQSISHREKLCIHPYVCCLNLQNFVICHFLVKFGEQGQLFAGWLFANKLNRLLVRGSSCGRKLSNSEDCMSTYFMSLGIPSNKLGFDEQNQLFDQEEGGLTTYVTNNHNNNNNSNNSNNNNNNNKTN